MQGQTNSVNTFMRIELHIVFGNSGWLCIESEYSGSTPKGCAAEASARLMKEASSCGLSAVDV